MIAAASFRAAFAAVFIMGFLSAAYADKRVALVIGNGAYSHADPLTNPLTDARNVRGALTRLGFEIVYGEDVDQGAMRRLLGKFAGTVDDADVAIVYFAGHGATFGDIPYVVPTDAKFASLNDIPYELIPVETLIGELRRAKGVRIALLDACRDNAAEKALKRSASRALASGQGLAPVRDAHGLIIAYGTQFLSTAADGPPNSDSPFTAALLKHIERRGIGVQQMLFDVANDVIAETKGEQNPEISVSLFKPYMLAGPAAEAFDTKPAPIRAERTVPTAPVPPVRTAAPAPSGKVAALEQSDRAEDRLLPANPMPTPSGQKIIGGSSPFTGLTVADIAPAKQNRSDPGDSGTGVIVLDVADHSRAATVNFQKGDEILMAAKRPINRVDDLRSVAAERHPYWRLSLRRNGTVITTVLAGDNKDEPDPVRDIASANTPPEDTSKRTSNVSFAGIRFRTLDGAARQRSAISAAVASGVVIEEVVPDSPAAQKGLRQGEVVMNFNMVSVRHPSEIAAQLDGLRKTGKRSVLLLVSSPKGEVRFVALSVAPDGARGHN